MEPSDGNRTSEGLRNWSIVFVLTLAFVGTVVLRRIARSGPQRYGMGAEFIEHLSRLRVLASWRERGDMSALRWFLGADGEYPPLLHVIANAASPLLGHEIADVGPLSIVWVALLGLGTGLAVTGWTGRPRVGGAAAVLAMLIPAVPAVATNYYYDLPMSSLVWLGVGLAAWLGRSRPVIAAVVAGVVLGAAALIKWTALPFAAVGLLATVRDRRSGAVAAGAGVLAMAIMAGFCATPGENSFTSAMRNAIPPQDVVTPDHGRSEGPLPDVLGAALTRPLRQITTAWSLGFFAWFPLAFLVGILSPLGALFLGPLAVRGLRRHPELRRPCAIVLGGGAMFFALWIHVQDERFLLTLAPAFAAAAAAGLVSIERARTRVIVATATVLALMGVAVDFHFGPKTIVNRAVELLQVEYRAVRVVARGLGLSSSDGGIGWLRADEQLPARRAYRDAVWDAMLLTDATTVTTVRDAPLFHDTSDEHWIDWRVAWDRIVLEEPQLDHLRHDDPRPAELLLARSGQMGIDPSRWTLLRPLGADDGGAELALWRRRAAVMPAPVPTDCAQTPDGLEVTILDAPDRSPRCTDRMRTHCTADYMAFLQSEAARQGATPVGDCAAYIQSLVDLGHEERPPAGWRPPSPETRGTAILGASGLGFLFDEASLVRRPLSVSVIERETKTAPNGTPYRRLGLLLEDASIGQMEAELLLPPEGEGPFPTVLVLPGHTEDAAYHRDRRFGWTLPTRGIAALIVTFRAYEQPHDNDVTRAFLCSGYSFITFRVYEAMVAMKYLLAEPLACNARLGVLGHSGGSIAGNLMAWLDVNPARVQVSDLTSGYRNIDPAAAGGWEVDCETHPGLHRMAGEISELTRAPRPVLRLNYAYAPCAECDEPLSTDTAAAEDFLQFFEHHLAIAPEEL